LQQCWSLAQQCTAKAQLGQHCALTVQGCSAVARHFIPVCVHAHLGIFILVLLYVLFVLSMQSPSGTG
jgi:type VI protein secretion system component VasF